MPGLHPTHIILIVIVALVVFGPKRLPELGRALGESIKEFQNAGKEMGNQFTEAVNEKPRTSENGVPAEHEEAKKN